MNKQKLKLSDLVVVTSNANKIAEINEILGTNHQVSHLDVPEIQSLDLDKVIAAKAKAAYDKIKKPVLVTDVSLEIEKLKGLPGTFVKFFLETLGTTGTVRLLGKGIHKAKATDAVAIYDGKNLKIFKGTIEGTLANDDRGEAGFGFDKVFIPNGNSKTWSELSVDEKNKISHRAKALKKLKEYLDPESSSG